MYNALVKISTSQSKDARLLAAQMPPLRVLLQLAVRLLGDLPLEAGEPERDGQLDVGRPAERELPCTREVHRCESWQALARRDGSSATSCSAGGRETGGAGGVGRGRDELGRPQPGLLAKWHLIEA
jgi:hypothetical protein